MRSSPAPGTGPCSLLSSSGRCTVYPFRPFVCRVYAAFDDPKYCADKDVLHVTYKTSSNEIFKTSMNWLMALNGQGAIADIRSFFPKSGPALPANT